MNEYIGRKTEKYMTLVENKYSWLGQIMSRLPAILLSFTLQALGGGGGHACASPPHTGLPGLPHYLTPTTGTWDTHPAWTPGRACLAGCRLLSPPCPCHTLPCCPHLGQDLKQDLPGTWVTWLLPTTCSTPPCHTGGRDLRPHPTILCEDHSTGILMLCHASFHGRRMCIHGRAAFATSYLLPTLYPSLYPHWDRPLYLLAAAWPQTGPRVWVAPVCMAATRLQLLTCNVTFLLTWVGTTSHLHTVPLPGLFDSWVLTLVLPFPPSYHYPTTYPSAPGLPTTPLGGHAAYAPLHLLCPCGRGQAG